jgi:hypothetical protein
MMLALALEEASDFPNAALAAGRVSGHFYPYRQLFSIQPI